MENLVNRKEEKSNLCGQKKKLLVTGSTFPRWEGDTEPRFIFVTMPPVAAQMMMKAVGFPFSVHISLKLLYPYSRNTSTLQSTL